MTQEETVLVATVVNPERRFRITQAQLDDANAQAKEEGNESPFIVQEDDCEGGLSYDQLDDAGKEEVKQNQKERQERLDAEAKKG